MLTRRNIFVGLLAAVALWLTWKGIAVLARSPERQVLDAQEELIRAVERRDWEAVGGMLTEDYSDEAGHDRALAVDDARQALAHFFTLTIQHTVTKHEVENKQASLLVQIRLEGNGAGLSQTVVTTVNGMAEPWEFRWRKEGAWPWTWRVERIHHPQLAAHVGSYR